MTPQSSRLTDTVDEMMLDAGQGQDVELRTALLALGGLASLPAPPPNAQLAALLASGPDELSWRRRLRRHRPAIVGLAVIAGMGLGATGVAASASGHAEKASTSVQHLLEDWEPSWTVSGMPAAAPATLVLPEPPPAGQLEPPPRGAAGQPAAPDDAPGRTSKTQTGDGGADRRGASGSAGDSRPGGSPEPKTPSDDTGKPAVQVPENARKLPAGVVPEYLGPKESGPGEAGNGSAGKSGAGQKAGPGAAWLKKFSR